MLSRERNLYEMLEIHCGCSEDSGQGAARWVGLILLGVPLAGESRLAMAEMIDVLACRRFWFCPPPLGLLWKTWYPLLDQRFHSIESHG